MTSSRAVFLDRDGTLIRDGDYLSSPEGVEILPGVSGALRAIKEAGFQLVVVSNQSGVARGLMDEAQVERVNDRMRELLRQQGVDVDGVYYCPFLDGEEAKVLAYRQDSDLRKPNPGMLLCAASERGIDLSQSWMIGDRDSDIVAGRRAGCKTILLANGHSARDDEVPDFRVRDLSAAATIITKQVLSGREESTEASDSETHSRDRRDNTEETEIVSLLTDIRSLLDKEARDRRHEDFSLRMLLATLLQMFAAVAFVWACMALFSTNTDQATPRFALAIILQLFALTAFSFDRNS